MKEKLKTLIALVLLITALVCITLGIKSGQADETLEKSTNICLECVGIG